MIESVRSALAFGGMRYSMILPDEVAATLNQLRREDLRGLFDALAEEPLKRWKQWVLINPPARPQVQPQQPLGRP
jgi:hypothetical protein